MLVNRIENDFGDEGLYIDISSRVNLKKFLLIDRVFYEEHDGRIYQQGRTIVIQTKGGRPISLGRYIMGLSKGDPRIVICKDRLLVDYRRDNLMVRDKRGLTHRPRKKSYTQMVRQRKIDEMENRRQTYMD